MNKTFLLGSLAAAAIALHSQAQTTDIINPTLLNGGFESPVLTASHKQGWDGTPDITNWTNTATNFAGAAATFTDDGVDLNAGGAHTGNQFAFYHAGEGGSFDLSNFTIRAGDQISLSWYGRADTIYMGLFTSTNGGFTGSTPLANTGIITQPTGTVAGQNGYLPYNFAYTVQATDTVGPLGLVIFNPMTGYANVDDITLSVTRAPEPSTYALMVAGLGGLMFVFRARRSMV